MVFFMETNTGRLLQMEVKILQGPQHVWLREGKSFVQLPWYNCLWRHLPSQISWLIVEDTYNFRLSPHPSSIAQVLANAHSAEAPVRIGVHIFSQKVFFWIPLRWFGLSVCSLCHNVPTHCGWQPTGWMCPWTRNQGQPVAGWGK